MAIEKINSLALSSIAEINSTAKASIAKFNGSEAASVSLTDYVSSGLEMHFNAGDENSYNSSTTPSTWTDISSNGYSMTLNNGPTEPNAGDNYIQFDGVDDYGEISRSFNVTTFMEKVQPLVVAKHTIRINTAS